MVNYSTIEYLLFRPSGLYLKFWRIVVKLDCGLLLNWILSLELLQVAACTDQ